MFILKYICYINCIYGDEIQQFVRFESLYISHPATKYLMYEKMKQSLIVVERCYNFYIDSILSFHLMNRMI